MTYQLNRYSLVFKTPFRLAHGTRTHTQALSLALHHQGKTGYGEATFPPYLAETAENTEASLQKILPTLLLPESPAAITTLADGFGLSPFTRAVLVNALTDLYLRVHGLSPAALYCGRGSCLTS